MGHRQPGAFLAGGGIDLVTPLEGPPSPISNPLSYPPFLSLCDGGADAFVG